MFKDAVPDLRANIEEKAVRTITEPSGLVTHVSVPLDAFVTQEVTTRQSPTDECDASIRGR